jgi:hypothetical protein
LPLHQTPEGQCVQAREITLAIAPTGFVTKKRQTPRPKVPQTGTVTMDAASIDEGPDIETCRAGQDFD